MTPQTVPTAMASTLSPGWRPLGTWPALSDSPTKSWFAVTLLDEATMFSVSSVPAGIVVAAKYFATCSTWLHGT